MEKYEIFQSLEALYRRLGDDRNFDNLSVSEIRKQIDDARRTVRFVLMELNVEKISRISTPTE
jgi:hypothetical protein